MAFKCSKLSQNFLHPTQRNYSPLACRGQAEYMTFVKLQIFYSIANHHNTSYFSYFSECSTAKYILNIKCLSRSKLRNQFVILRSLYVFVTKYFCTLSNKKVPQVEAALWDSCVLLGTTKITAKQGTKRNKSGIRIAIFRRWLVQIWFKGLRPKKYGRSWDFVSNGGWAWLCLWQLCDKLCRWGMTSSYLTLFDPWGEEGVRDMPLPRANVYIRKKSIGGNSDNFLNVC